VKTLVSCLQPDEELELDLVSEEALWTARGLAFHRLRIPDRGVPSEAAEAMEMGRLLASAAGTAGAVVHCRAGIGRATLVAALALIEEGASADDALREIRLARGRPVPDTEEQAEWLRSYAARRALERVSLFSL